MRRNTTWNTVYIAEHQYVLYYLDFFFPICGIPVHVYTMRKNQPTVEATEPIQLVNLYPLNIYRFLLGRDSFDLIQSQASLKIGVKIVTSLNTDRTARST